MSAGKPKQAVLKKSPEEGSAERWFVVRVLVTAKGGPSGPFLKNGTILDQHPVQGAAGVLLCSLLGGWKEEGG